MPRFAANLSRLFTEWPFLDRYQAAADAGFEAVECVSLYDHAPDAIARARARAAVRHVLFNIAIGDPARSERGLAALAGREADLEASIERAIPYLAATGATRLHLMAGDAPSADPRALATYERNVLWACDRLADFNVVIVIEPINRRDMPDYFLNDYAMAEDLIVRANRSSLRLLFDMYHRQIMHGDVARAFARLQPLVGHVQIAGVPERQEPDEGELRYEFLFAELDRLGYDGHVGCEYSPRGGTLEGLGWFAAWRRQQRLGSAPA